MNDFTCDTIDGPSICTVIQSDGCCPPSICNLDLVSFICSFFAYMPKGPLWDYWRRLRVEQLRIAGGPPNIPEVTIQGSDNANCLTIINHAEYTATNLFKILTGPLITAFFESNPLTAFNSRSKWLNNFGWEDCFSPPVTNDHIEFFTPYKAVCNALLPIDECLTDDGQYNQMPGNSSVNQNPVIDIEALVKAACPPDLKAAVEHAILVALSRNQIGVIKNFDGINFILEPLKARIDIINSGTIEPCEQVMMYDCNQIPGNTPCYPHRPLLHITLSATSRLIEAGPGISEQMSCDAIQGGIPTLIPISYVFDGIVMPITDNCPEGTVRGNGTICPALMAAECILTSILPSNIKYDLVREQCPAPPNPHPQTFLLDNLSNISRAYSLRRLATAYLGPAVRVIQGFAELDIYFDEFGNLDTTALLIFANGGTVNVKTWYDQSGRGHNMGAFGGSYTDSAALVISGVLAATIGNNHRPSLFMSATYNNWLFNSDVDSIQPVVKPDMGMIVAVGKANSGSAVTSAPTWFGSSALLGSGSSNPNGLSFNFNFNQGGTIAPDTFSPDRYTGSWLGTQHDMVTSFPYTYGTETLFAFRWSLTDAIQTKGYMNGGAPRVDTQTFENDAQTGPFNIGKGGSPFNHPFDGLITEVLTSSTEQSTLDFNRILSNQSAYYGIPFNPVSV